MRKTIGANLSDVKAMKNLNKEDKSKINPPEEKKEVNLNYL